MDLEREMRHDSKEDAKYFNKIFADGIRPGETVMEVDATPEEIHLWRYLFHVNSTKIVPTLWQKEKVPIGPDSAWTVTFISPLYLDYPFDNIINGKK